MSLYSLCWNLLPLGGLLAGALAGRWTHASRYSRRLMVAANALVLMAMKRLRALG